MNINSSNLKNLGFGKKQIDMVGKPEEEKHNYFKTNVDRTKEESAKGGRSARTAYKVSISDEGRSKSEQMEFEAYNRVIEKAADVTDTDKDMLASESDAGTEFGMRLSKALERLGNGEKLSEKEEKWFVTEVKNMLGKQYNYVSQFKLTKEQIQQIDEIKAAIQRRNDIFNEMMHELDSVEVDLGMDFSFLTEQLEQKQKEEEVETLKESVEDKDEEETKVKDAPKDTEDVEEETDEEKPGDILVEEDPLFDERRADKFLEDRDEAFDQLESYFKAEYGAYQKDEKMLDHSFSVMDKMMDSNEISIEDKATLFQDFMKNSYDLAYKREVNHIVSAYDSETRLLAKVLRENHNDLSEVISSNPYKKNIIDQDMVINVLQKLEETLVTDGDKKNLHK